MRAMIAAAIALLGAMPPGAPRVAERTVVVRGTITDRESGSPIPDVRIMKWGTPLATTSNDRGEYVLRMPVPDRDTLAVLQVLRVGYNRDSVRVNLRADTVRADVALQQSVLRLQE